jgi:PBP1b-binding outer membrane lipoprotein LpoB
MSRLLCDRIITAFAIMLLSGCYEPPPQASTDAAETEETSSKTSSLTSVGGLVQ